MTTTDNGYVFTAAGTGKRYRIDGIRVPVHPEKCVTGAYGLEQIIEGKAHVITTTPSEYFDPRIIVTPVEPTYEVTVTLTEEQFKRFHSAGSRMFVEDHVYESAELIGSAIKADRYREVEG